MKFDPCPADDEISWLIGHIDSASDVSSASLGLYCWEATYRSARGRPTARTPDEWAQAYSERLVSRLQSLTSHPVNPESRMQLAFLAKWAHLAYTTISVGERYAAALMASSVSGEVVRDLKPPWDAFVLMIPGGLLAQYDRIRFGVYDVPAVHESGEPNARVRMAVYSTVTHELLVHNSTSIEDCLCEPESELLFGLAPFAGEDERVMRLAQRLIAGAILAAGCSDSCTERLHPGGKKKRKTEAPAHRVVTIGRTVTLDVRSSIRDFVAGRTPHMLTVQSLVRGHYKRQAHGPELLQRKIIWIEPYWRGPDDAPLLAKTHHLK